MFSLVPLVIVAGLVCVLWSVVGSSMVVHQPRYSAPVHPRDYDLPSEEIRLTAADGISIAGWLIRHPAPDGTLILLHGFGTAKADLLDVAHSFYREGRFHLFLLDFRGHGDSGGETISFGKKEILDVEAVIEFLSKDPALKGLPIGCYGISMGGAIGLIAAARFPQIRAVVSDSAYADWGKAIARGIWMSYHIPRVPFGQLVIWGAELRLRCRTARLSPVLKIGKIAPRGVLLIHGAQDKVVLPEEGKMLFQAAGEPKGFWLVQDAEHVASFFNHKEEYLSRVLGFLKDGLCRTS